MTRKTAASTATTGIVGELDGLMNMETAAEVLGISVGTLKNMVHGRGGRSTLPSVRLGGRRMIRRSELAEFMANLEA